MLRMLPPDVAVDRRADGSILVYSRTPLPTPARAVGVWLADWAARVPERVFLAERAGKGWRKVTYAAALDAARRIGTALLARGLGPERPVAILSDNSVDHALLAMGAMQAGVPVAPISPAYSLISRDHAKLRDIFALLEPGLVWADDADRFGPALAAVGARVTPLAELLAQAPDQRIDDAFAAVGPHTLAKVLFTSGSTGAPKGVLNTQRMMCANQAAWAAIWPFLHDAPPVLCDWLPWNHTFGGNANFNMVLANGGTLYIDNGKPAPGLIETTVRNLAEVAPTLYFNVPRGYDLLLPFLEQDADLRRNFFSQLGMLFHAGAALPPNLWDRLSRLAQQERGDDVAMISAWGSTETAPMATCVHWPLDRPGNLGTPAPGTTLKLVPSGERQEIRVRGPNVSPGYFRRPDLTAAAFDEEGFYCIGDAVRMVDEADAARGLLFDGRVSEDFKLASGTWVHVGAVRMALIAACDPLVQDAVITGHDRDRMGAMVFINAAARAALGLDEAGVRDRLAAALARMRQAGAASSMVPERLLVLAEPASIDAGEITDKGYINQRAVLTRRARLVEELYAGGVEVVR